MSNDIAVGDRFGSWTVLDLEIIPRNRVLCRCDCGTERPVNLPSLRRGLSVSCGCMKLANSHARKLLSPYIKAGEQFGRLVALEDATHSSVRIRCRCDCGKERVVTARQLRRPGRAVTSCGKACGCREIVPYVTAGERYGLWTVLETAPKGRFGVLCRCDCGTERRTWAESLKDGRSRSCGCGRTCAARDAPYIPAGERFGRLLVLEDASGSEAYVLCRCDCGTERKVQAHNLTRKASPTVSCGCFHRDQLIAMAKQVNTTHGLSYHPLYALWASIVQRTTKPGSLGWENYGGRGIRIYEPWRTDVAAFIAWITEELGARPPGRSLDRVNNDGPYAPGNLRWSTRREQSLNRRSLAKLTRERDELRAQLAAALATSKPRRRQEVSAQAETLF